MKSTVIVYDEEDDEDPIQYAAVLQEEEYEDETVAGFSSLEYAQADEEVSVQPWEPERIFFHIQ